jgi:hypothetical protein
MKKLKQSLTSTSEAAPPDYLKDILLNRNDKAAKEQYISNAGYAFDQSDDGRTLIIKQDEMQHLEAQVADAQTVVERLIPFSLIIQSV